MGVSCCVKFLLSIDAASMREVLYPHGRPHAFQSCEGILQEVKFDVGTLIGRLSGVERFPCMLGQISCDRVACGRMRR